MMSLLPAGIWSQVAGGDFYSKEIGTPIIYNYDTKELGWAPQNWSITKDSLGLLYVANSRGLLVQDGNGWDLIKTPNKNPIRIVQKNDKNEIYVGGFNFFGKLEYDQNGSRQIQVLSDSLPADAPSFSGVYEIHFLHGDIFFRAPEALFCLREGKWKIWAAPTRFFQSFMVNGHIYLRVKGRGILKLENDHWAPLPAGDFFSDTPVTGIYPFDAQAILIATRDALYLNKDGENKRFITEADDFVKNHRLYHVLLLKNNLIFLGTLNGGLAVIDRLGRNVLRLSQEHGLLSPSIYVCFEDGASLWIGSALGVSKINFPSSITNFKPVHDGNPISKILRFNNKIIIGTHRGCYFMDATTSPSVFKPYHAIKDRIWDMMLFDDQLLIGHEDGLYVIDHKEEVGALTDLRCGSLTRSKIDANRVYTASIRGLNSLYYHDREWTIENRFDDFSGSVSDIVEDEAGNLWLNHRREWMTHVLFSDPKRLEGTKYERLDSSHGLPMEKGFVNQIDHQIFFSSSESEQLYAFDATANKFRSTNHLPHIETDVSIKSLVSFDQLYFQFMVGNGHIRTSHLLDLSGKESKIMKLDNYTIRDEVGRCIFVEDSVVWYGGDRSVFRHDLRYEDPSEKWHTLINRVSVGDDSTVHYSPYGDASPTLAYGQARYRFEYSATSRLKPGSNQYQFYLEGEEPTWSKWTLENQKDYTNLSEGTYRFHVRARNIKGETSPSSTFSFTILPPWYRSWWAYVLYLLAGGTMIFLLVKWRSRQLEHEKLALQNLVTLKTSELQQRNLQLEEQKEQLALQSAALQEADDLKSKLFANISHEFRTPLTLIKGPIDRAFYADSDSISKKAIYLIKNNADRLLQLVNQLLDLAKVDAGQMQIENAEGDVFKAIRAAASSFSSMAAHQNIDYRISVPATGLWTAFDRDKIDKILYNLLSNAFKFTGPDGQIQCVASHEDEILTISVQDNGPGIADHQKEKLFDRFYQVDGSSTRPSEGTGIGLALVKELIHMMEGTIEVRSAPNQGSIFTVSIPLVEIQGLTIKTDANNVKTIGKEELAYDAVQGHSKDAKILVVEDHLDMRQFVVEQVERYQVLQATDGKMGFELAVKHIPDLIITDLMMPTMDGVEMTQLLKMDERTSHIPIIMLTAKAGTENLIHGMDSGADHYLTKPFNGKELLSRVKNLLRQREMLREKFSTATFFKPRMNDIPSQEEIFLQKVQDVLELNFSDAGFGVPMMMQAMAMSKTQLHRKIKALTNRTPAELIRLFRIEKAIQLLMAGERITQVAFKVGFKDPSYFAKVFRLIKHQSPKDFVKNLS